MILSLPIFADAFVAPRHRDCRRAVAVAGILCAVMPIPAAAVGLGAITQQSAIGQALRVVVPVTLGPGEEVSAECFKLAAAGRDGDGVPQTLFGRVSVERSPSGTTLVVTSPRPVNEPVVRLTLQAGCETAVRREYTLFMDPPAIEAPVVAADLTPREALGLAPPGSATPEPSRAPRSQPRAPTRPATRTAGAPSSPSATEPDGSRKAAPPKGRVVPTAQPKSPPAVAADRPRLSVSSGAPATLTGGATEADRERARQERANAIEAETQVLRQRIVELTAIVERMQQDLKAQELAEQATEANKSAAVAATETPKSAVAAEAAPSEAAKPAAAPTTSTPPPMPASSWWEDNAPLVAAVVGLPLLIAVGLLWRRRRDASEDDRWRTARATAVGSELPTLSRTSMLRNAPAGLALRGGDTTAPGIFKEGDTRIPEHEPIGALAVSALSHVTEEARVFLALGHTDRAIEVLHEHVKRLPRSMPAAWLMLLDLYHANGNRSEFHRLAEDFHVQFNAQTPLWEAFGSEDAVAGGLEGFPHIEQQVVELWRQPGCHAFLERLLHDNRDGRRNGFPLSTYSDILLLLQVLDAPSDIDIDEDLVAAGKLDAEPKATSAHAAPTPDVPITTTSRARKPMPPDPAASRPVQQPIRFEIEAPDSGGKKKS